MISAVLGEKTKNKKKQQQKNLWSVLKHSELQISQKLYWGNTDNTDVPWVAKALQ